MARRKRKTVPVATRIARAAAAIRKRKTPAKVQRMLGQVPPRRGELSLAALAYRDKFAFAVAPALVTEFMRGGGPAISGGLPVPGSAWDTYEDLAETLDNVSTAFARRFARLQDGR